MLGARKLVAIAAQIALLALALTVPNAKLRRNGGVLVVGESLPSGPELTPVDKE
jgi:hypothetical protein